MHSCLSLSLVVASLLLVRHLEYVEIPSNYTVKTLNFKRQDNLPSLETERLLILNMKLVLGFCTFP
jgi:hypothetical protein